MRQWEIIIIVLCELLVRKHHLVHMSDCSRLAVLREAHGLFQRNQDSAVWTITVT